MGVVRSHMTISVDGYTSGPNQTFEKPFGDYTEHFDDWLFAIKTAREMFGEEGGETGPSDDVFRERFQNVGAYIMGRHMFGGGTGAWPEDPPWKGWWGDNPPYHAPVYVLTHYPREPLPMEGGTTFHFVTDGIQSALDHARLAAGDQDIVIAGGAETVRQYLAARLLDELEFHQIPEVVSDGARLLEGLPPDLEFEQVRVVPGTNVTHLKYRFVR